MKQAWKIIQLSDLHLFADPEADLLGVKTQESFAEVLNLLKAENEEMDAIILSGDLSQDGSMKAYRRVAEMLLPFKVPVFWVEGNHDDSEALREIFPRDNIINDKQFIMGNWNFILLNSQKKYAVEGFLSENEFEFLQKNLMLYPQSNTIIVMHHQVVPVGSNWLDNLGLANADEFWSLIAKFKQVKAIMCGHVHQEGKIIYNHVDCYTVPSTCIQFKINQKDFELELISPGYRWLKVYDDGRYETGIKRTAHYVGLFDEHAKGY